jgi:imidazole glycerol-phosphate synthase subunit HisH
MKIAILDCGAGNLHSVRKAFTHVASPLSGVVEVTTSPDALMDSTHIVLPGVGTYRDCMEGLLRHQGLREALERRVLTDKIPLFAICVGMQMLLTRGHEFGVTEGLGWFAGDVVKLSPEDSTLRVPHMGWNNLHITQPHPVFSGIEEGAHAYFVHSYHATGVAAGDIAATVDYGGQIVACIAREHIVATQFHPEKSQAVGLKMISNFLGM